MPAYVPNNLYAVGTGGNCGVWSRRVGTFASFGNIAGWTIRSLAFDPQGTMWCVGSLYNVAQWNGTQWVDPQNVSSWAVRHLAFDQDGTMWCVGSLNNVGKWNGTKWDDQGNLGGTPLLSLTFDGHGTMWGVNTNYEVASWKTTPGGWTEFETLGGWTITQLAFDPEGNRWCVGSMANVGKWNGTGWTDQGLLGGWELQWLAWSPSTPDGTDFQLLGQQVGQFAALLSDERMLNDFKADPISVMSANGVNLAFLSGTQLSNLASLIANDFPNASTRVLVGAGAPGDVSACWKCRITLWIVFTAVNGTAVYFTGGIGALFEGPVIEAIATALGMAVATVQRVVGQLVAGSTIDLIIVQLCSAGGYCASEAQPA